MGFYVICGWNGQTFISIFTVLTVTVHILLWKSFTCFWSAGCLKCSFSFPYPFSPPTAQCFDSQLYRVCKGGGPVWLLPAGRMETRRLHDSCGGKNTPSPSHLISYLQFDWCPCLVPCPVSTKHLRVLISCILTTKIHLYIWLESSDLTVIFKKRNSKRVWLV